MLVSYYPKEQKLVMLLTTAHDQPVLDNNAKKKTGAILFDKEQRCGVDILKFVYLHFAWKGTKT